MISPSRCKYCGKYIDHYQSLDELQVYRDGALNTPKEVWEDKMGWLVCTPHGKETYYHQPMDKSESFQRLYNKLNE